MASQGSEWRESEWVLCGRWRWVMVLVPQHPRGDGNGTRSSLFTMPSETDDGLENGEVVLPPVLVCVEGTARGLLDLRGKLCGRRLSHP